MRNTEGKGRTEVLRLCLRLGIEAVQYAVLKAVLEAV